jgi:hypothetical protein
VITRKRLDKEESRNPGIIISNSITAGVIDDSALANTRTLKSGLQATEAANRLFAKKGTVQL